MLPKFRRDVQRDVKDACIIVRVEDDMRAAFKQYADANRTTVSAIIRKIIEEKIGWEIP